MELENKTIIHIAQYAAPYEGNFIKSLKFLETSLAEIGCKMAYIFPEKAKEQSWWNDFEKSHTVYTTQNDVKKSSRELYNIFEIERPAIIHTHFEGYDTPAKIASDKFRKKYGFNIQNVWHLHDYFTYVSNPIKKLYQKWCFFNHYCLMAKDVAVIGVCDEVKAFVSVFKKISGNPFYSEITIPNGIDISRISVQKQWSHGVKTFLAYGGRNVQKRIDIILRAFMSFPTPPPVNSRQRR